MDSYAFYHIRPWASNNIEASDSSNMAYNQELTNM